MFGMTTADATTAADAAKNTTKDQAIYAPGLTVRVRDELWLITKVTQSVDGYLLTVRGLSDFVRDSTASFYTAIDTIEVVDPAKVRVVADDSPGYRTSRLWLETTLRQTPVPLYQDELSVAEDMLMDPLDYQLTAVKKALSQDNLRPRVLIADAVGLGKTLEIGMILAELIRRGRGERILVVTPKHIMEQFQQEMWTRFAIPLVRLDSAGIQRIKQKLPGSRNPFSYFSRVIVSLDTLKAQKHLINLKQVRWDVVVMDEIHNATNAGTKNNDLAKALAPTTESLLLASATPHNGNPESFKEILRLLDPTAVLPNGEIDTDAIDRLLIRRHRHSKEVASVVGPKWAERAEPKNIPVEASPEENAVARELETTWVHPEGTSPIPEAVNKKGQTYTDRLFPWTLVKSFLSSPAALDETITTRLKSVAADDTTQREALERLQALNAKVTTQNSNKYAALVNYLQEIGVGKGKQTRAVVFSERVATLHWLKEHLAKDLKLGKGAVEVMHGGLSDQEQMHLVDAFKRTDSPLRVLVTGDVASEGVNLHTLCHDLIHFDIPWSLIRIQQRNGRVDRYGQTNPPQITALLLDTQGSGIGELRVLRRLIEREHEAHAVLGDAAPLMGKHTIRGEEDEIRKVLRGEAGFDDIVKAPEQVLEDTSNDISALLARAARIAASTAAAQEAQDNQDTPGTQTTGATSLYPSELAYLTDALNAAFHSQPEKPVTNGGVAFAEHPNGVAELAPPEDLRRRLDVLPQDYLAARRVREIFQLATTHELADDLLRRARTGDEGSTWPRAHFLGPLHPVTDWAADRALASLSGGQIPAIRAAEGTLDFPTVLLMGTLTNKRGQVISRAFVTVANGIIPQTIINPVDWLHSVGLTADAINTGDLELPENTQQLIADSVEITRGQLTPMLQAAREQAQQRIEYWMQRAENWEHTKHDTQGAQSSRTVRRSQDLLRQEKALIASLAPDRELIRPLVLVLPNTH